MKRALALLAFALALASAPDARAQLADAENQFTAIAVVVGDDILYIYDNSINAVRRTFVDSLLAYTARNLSGDFTCTNAGVCTVSDGSHNHVISNIDAFTSSAFASQVSDETGSGFLVFGTSPVLATPSVTGKVDRNNVAVSDDDCAGEQGLWWYDTTDSAFEFCNANSGTPSGLGLENIVEDTTPQLGGDLDLNNNFITAASGRGVKDGNGALLLEFTVVGSAVNYVDISNNASGSGPIIAAQGTTENIDLQLQAPGSGVVTADGVEVATTSGAQTLTNKSISGDQINSGTIPAARVGSAHIDALAEIGDLCGGTEILQRNSGDTAWECIATPSGGSSEWTDTGTVLHPTETGDDVALGSATLVNSSKLSIDGDADQVQLTIQGHSTQTDYVFIVENSAGTEGFTVSASGAVTIGQNGPALSFVGDTDTGLYYESANHFTLRSGGSAKVNVSTDVTVQSDLDITGGEASLGSTTQDGTLVIHDDDAGGDATVTIQAADATGTSYTLTLPGDDGTSGQFLQTNGAGVLTWATASGSGDIADVGSCSTGNCGNEGGNDVFPLLHEGTANTSETTFQVTDPTADRTVTFPDATGEVSLLGQTIDLTSEVTGAAPDANVANDLTLAGATIGTSAITLVQSANPTPTLEGVIEWETDTNEIHVGDGTGTQVFVAGAHTVEVNDLSSAVTWANVPDANVAGADERDEVCSTTDLSSSCEINADVIDFADVKYDNTLAASPALAVDECYLVATTTGGGFICEGSTADTQEQLFLVPDINDNDATYRIVVDGTQVTDLEGTGLSITTGTLNVATADATTQGIVELATTAETTTGTDATRAVTPDGLEDGFDGSTNIVTVGTITTGTWSGSSIADANVDNDITINSSVLITTGVGLDAIGAVDMDYGSADVTDHTFLTDGTGDAEIVLPNDAIGAAELAEVDYGDFTNASNTFDIDDGAVQPAELDVQEGYREWLAMSADGTECTTPTESAISPSSAVGWKATCTMSSSETDGFFYTQGKIPADYSNASTPTFRVTVKLITDGGAGTIHGVIGLQCFTAGDTIDDNWTEAELDISLDAGDVVNDVKQGASSASLTGESCAANDYFHARWKVCDTDATPSSNCTSSAGFENDFNVLAIDWTYERDPQ